MANERGRNSLFVSKSMQWNEIRAEKCHLVMKVVSPMRNFVKMGGFFVTFMSDFRLMTRVLLTRWVLQQTVDVK